MVIVKIQGGLGNQMFQYAFALSIAKKDRLVKLDVSYYQQTMVRGQDQGLEIFRLFDIELPRATLRDAYYFLKKNLNTDDTISYHLRSDRYFIKDERISEHIYYPEVFHCDNCYFDGYWQHISYLNGLKKHLHKLFCFKPFATEDSLNSELLKRIDSCNSVSIHIRRGDYLHTSDLYPLPQQYYIKAMEIVRNQTQVSHFFVFSDDMEWAKGMIGEQQCAFVTGNSGDNSYKDMVLMSHCKHNIIANSSFSWWSAWLNKNPRKLVIAPKKWVTGNFDLSFLPKNWQTV